MFEASGYHVAYYQKHVVMVELQRFLLRDITVRSVLMQQTSSHLSTQRRSLLQRQSEEPHKLHESIVTLEKIYSTKSRNTAVQNYPSKN